MTNYETFQIILIEFLNRRKNAQKPIVICDREVPRWIWRAYCAVAVYGFGAACSQLSTDVLKYQIGRLRPHFFNVCRPTVNCSLPDNMHRYIEDFVCENDSEGRKLKEMRWFFPVENYLFTCGILIRQLIRFLNKKNTHLYDSNRLRSNYVITSFLQIIVSFWTLLVLDVRHVLSSG